MGFLSRKSKRSPVVVEEPHPLVEELEQMEEAVPEREFDEYVDDFETDERWPAGPVMDEDDSSSRDDAAGESPSSMPPAGEADSDLVEDPSLHEAGVALVEDDQDEGDLD